MPDHHLPSGFTKIDGFQLKEVILVLAEGTDDGFDIRVKDVKVTYRSGIGPSPKCDCIIGGCSTNSKNCYFGAGTDESNFLSWPERTGHIKFFLYCHPDDLEECTHMMKMRAIREAELFVEKARIRMEQWQRSVKSLQ